MTDFRSFITKNKSASILLALALLGTLILVFSSGDGTEKNGEKTASEEYIKGIEHKIEQMVSQVCAGEATVIVTAESEEEYIYAENVQEVTEKSSSEASRTSKTSECAVVGGQALIKSVVKPKIRGIAVVCKNGDDPTIQGKIIGLLSCAYGLSSAKIYVSGN